MASPWIPRLLIGAVVTVVVSTVAANVVVVVRTGEAITSDRGLLRPATVVIVPGSAVYPDGTLGRPVRQRVAAAIELYRADLVEKILVSGDNGRAGYNEPDAMRDVVLDAGIDPADIFTDYAGFSTWHTMRRAADVFGVADAIVVTQSVYAPRTVDLGEAAGIDVQGYVVGQGRRQLREWLARVSGLIQATFRLPVTGGEPIPIGGDGRDSWADPST